MKFLRALFVLAAVGMLTSCTADPSLATVAVDVDGCGFGFGGSVAGVVVGDEKVVTVAHGVIQADDLKVDGHSGQVIGLDVRTDLALLAVPGLTVRPVDMATVEAGEEVSVVGGLVTPSVVATVVDTPTIRIEEVLGTRRVQRQGLELRAALEEGDSGAGVFDSGGRLVGVVFAVNDDRDGTAWAVAAAEVQALLEAAPRSWKCDPDRSRIVEAQP